MGSSKKKQVIGYKYGATMHLGIGLAMDELYQINIGGKTAWRGSVKANTSFSINNPGLFGGKKGEGGIEGTLDVMFGKKDQLQNKRLVSLLGNAICAFRGTATLLFDGWLCAMNPYPKSWEICYRRIKAEWPDDTVWYPEKITILLAGGKIQSMNPAHMLYESYISDSWGSGEPIARMDDAAWRKAADTLYTENFGLCVEWKVTDDLGSFRDLICAHIGAALDTDPETGQITIRLIRDDYNIDDLQVFTEDTGLLEIKFDSSNNTEVPSQIIVKYTDAITFEQRPAMANNPAVAQGQGGRCVETTEYIAIPTGELATRVAYRDLKMKTSGLKRVTVKLDRRAYNIKKGEPLRIKTLRRKNNIDLIVRPERIEEQFINDGTIKMIGLQDVFGLPKIAFTETPVAPAPIPPAVPLIINDRLIQEATYRELVSIVDPANLQLIDQTTAFIFAIAKSPGNGQRSYNLYSTVSGSNNFLEQDDAGTWCPVASCDQEISFKDTVINLIDSVFLEDVELGSAALINNEIVRIDAIDLVNSKVTIARGCVDTVPATHPTGSVIWFYDGYETADETEYTKGLEVHVKLVSNTATEQLALSQAPIDVIKPKGRQALPYPPGNLKVNNIAYPTTITGILTVTWAHRDRLLQADQLIDTTVNNIGLEPNATYNLTFINSGATVHSIAGLTANFYTWVDEDNGSGELYQELTIQLEAIRDGLTSYQKHSITIRRT